MDNTASTNTPKTPPKVVVRQDKQKELLLEELKKVPIVEICCKKTGIGRATYYRWRQSDDAFREQADLALKDGVQLINELAESKLISQIQEENLGAIIFWLKSRNPAYKEKLEVSAKSENSPPLTVEQKALIEKALQLSPLKLSNPHTDENPRSNIDEPSDDGSESAPSGGA